MSLTGMQEARRAKVSRFIKSYKYKHKFADQADILAAQAAEMLPIRPICRPDNQAIDNDDDSFRNCDRVGSEPNLVSNIIGDFEGRQKAEAEGGEEVEKYEFKRMAPNTNEAIQIDQPASKQQVNLAARPSSRFYPRANKFTQILTFVLFQILPIILVNIPSTCFAFCPIKCLCNDQTLTANCTQVPSLSIVPMTLNPLLKQLILNNLPIWELSDSLSVYRQLENLNLNSNQLRQIRYQNFNFKPAPNSIHFTGSGPQNPSEYNHNPNRFSGNNNADPRELNLNNEQLAKQLRASIDRGINSVFGSQQLNGDKIGAMNFQNNGLPAPTMVASESGQGEIRFHLRELHLANNKIELLGDSAANSRANSDEDYPQEDEQGLDHNQQRRSRLKSSDLERLAPFLTLSRLETLNLSANKLVKLRQHTFLGLLNLRQLDLSHNQLEYVDRHAFVGLIELRILRLNHNRLAHHLSQLGLSLCRAPMNELLYFDLSDNAKLEQQLEIILPNQMFICAPRLVSLRLDALNLRHIQVNAFDNLHQLETLNLSRNQLEQVPSDSLNSIANQGHPFVSLSSNNLSLSLRQLDLSENLIEFVNANSFARLPNLERLSMNSMPRLVSFDLGSLSGQPDNNGRYESLIGQLPAIGEQFQVSGPNSNNKSRQNIEQLVSVDGQFKSALKNFLPEHLFARLASSSPSSSSLSNPSSNQINPSASLINEQLIELQLKHNSRLQSFHSSLADQRKMKFARLRLIDLEGAKELRELELEQMIDFGQVNDLPMSDYNVPKLRINLSNAKRLNCSSCAMSWLVKSALMEARQKRQRFAMFSQTNSQQTNQPIWPHQNNSPFPFVQVNEQPLIELVGVDSIGCSWPLSVALVQLLEFENTFFSTLFEHCNQQLKTAPRGSFENIPANFNDDHHHQHLLTSSNSERNFKQTLNGNSNSNVTMAIGTTTRVAADNEQVSNGDEQHPSTASMVLASLLSVLFAALCAKFLLNLIARHRCAIKWRSVSLATTSCTTSSPVDTSSSTSSSSSSSSNSSKFSAVQDSNSTHLVQPNGFKPIVRRDPVEVEVYQSGLGQAANVIRGESGGQQQQQQLSLLFKALHPTAAAAKAKDVAQIERAHRRGNLFSRLVERLRVSSAPGEARQARGTNWKSTNGWPTQPLVSSSLAAGGSCYNSRAGESYGAPKGQLRSHIIENVVYNGNYNGQGSSNFVSGTDGDKVLAIGHQLSLSQLEASQFNQQLLSATNNLTSGRRRHPFVQAPNPCRSLRAGGKPLRPANFETRPGADYLTTQTNYANYLPPEPSQMLMNPRPHHNQLQQRQLQAIEMDPAEQLDSVYSLAATCQRQRPPAKRAYYSNGRQDVAAPARCSFRRVPGAVEEEEEEEAGLGQSQLRRASLSVNSASTQSPNNERQRAELQANFKQADGHIYVTLDRPIKQPIAELSLEPLGQFGGQNE